jgi:hypothetical protein
MHTPLRRQLCDVSECVQSGRMRHEVPAFVLIAFRLENTQRLDFDTVNLAPHRTLVVSDHQRDVTTREQCTDSPLVYIASDNPIHEAGCRVQLVEERQCDRRRHAHDRLRDDGFQWGPAVAVEDAFVRVVFVLGIVCLVVVLLDRRNPARLAILTIVAIPRFPLR